MIVVDTSALMAIYLGEADAEAMFQAIVADDDPVIAAPSKFEFLMVASGRKADGSNAAQLLDSLAIATHAWTDAHAEGALEVFLRYGKGRHKAALNFGDCMAYTLAKSLEAPLLYKGDDFSKTDIPSALRK